MNPVKTLSVPTAGKVYFGLGRNGSYDAARRGELPVIKIGRRLRVPVVALERMLNVDVATQADPIGGRPDHAV